MYNGEEQSESESIHEEEDYDEDLQASKFMASLRSKRSPMDDELERSIEKAFSDSKAQAKSANISTSQSNLSRPGHLLHMIEGTKQNRDSTSMGAQNKGESNTFCLVHKDSKGKIASHSLAIPDADKFIKKLKKRQDEMKKEHQDVKNFVLNYVKNS